MKKLLLFLMLPVLCFAGDQIKNATVTGTFDMSGSTSKTGTGNVVLATSPALVTPTLGSATATSLSTGAITLSNVIMSGVSTGKIRDGVDNSTGDGVAQREILIENTATSANTIAIRNNSASGFPAWEIRNNSNVATFAGGYGNPSSPIPMFVGRNYLQSWAKGSAPPDLVISMDGTYGSIGSGDRFYDRMVFVGSSGNIVFNRLAPYGNAASYPCFTMLPGGSFTTSYGTFQYSGLTNGTVGGASFWSNGNNAVAIALGQDNISKSAWWGMGTAADAPVTIGWTGSTGAFELRYNVTEGAANPFSTGTVGFSVTAGDATVSTSLKISSGGTPIKRIKFGSTTLVAGTKVVTESTVSASSIIILTPQTLGTIVVPAALAVTARSNGVSFTITSAQVTDTSVVGWQILEP